MESGEHSYERGFSAGGIFASPKLVKMANLDSVDFWSHPDDDTFVGFNTPNVKRVRLHGTEHTEGEGLGLFDLVIIDILWWFNILAIKKRPCVP